MIYPNRKMDQEPINEIELVDNIKKAVSDTLDMRAQWKKVADSFVKHKWLYRYITDKQKVQLEKHYAAVCDEKTPYSIYKRSFNAICKFMGVPHHMVIIENMSFSKDKQDKEQWEVAIKYSKGLAKVKIPEGVRLIHVSPVEGIKELIPSFRSKVKGKYMYPTKRVFFTVTKDIKPTQAGLEGQKTNRYTPRQDINEAFIDPTYSEFSSGSVYVETDNPIPVMSFKNKMLKLFGLNKKKNDKKEEEK